MNFDELWDKCRIVNPTFPTEIRFKLLSEDAKTPTKSRTSDAGFDLYATEDVTIAPSGRALVHTDVAMEIPKGYAGLVCGRSGNTIKRGLVGQLGVIDSGFRAGIGIMAFNTTSEPIVIKKGERAGQLLIVPVPDFTLVEVEELSDSDRGLDGFGSSGKY